jgi:hypothetical protein
MPISAPISELRAIREACAGVGVDAGGIHLVEEAFDRFLVLAGDAIPGVAEILAVDAPCSASSLNLLLMALMSARNSLPWSSSTAGLISSPPMT